MFKNPMVDVRPPTDKLGGFWRAVVEDNNDPLKAGRVRVRIHGLHTENILVSEIDGIPVEELPWAQPCMPIIEGSVSGYGSWSVPLQGSHVMVFFEAMNLTQPRYFATMPGIPEESEEVLSERNNPDASKGFRDPDNVYPEIDKLGEPDVDRLARGVTANTSVETKNSNRDLAVDKACGGTWDEPQSPYAAEYPHNFVLSTHGGIQIEIDSTPGEERLNIWHPSKSYIEIDKDGQMVIKNESHRYEVIISDNNIHVKGNRNLTTDLNYNRLTKVNECIEVSGNRIENITGNETRTIEGNVDETIEGDETREIDGDVDQTIHGGGECQVDGILNLTVDGKITVNGNGTILINSGDVEITGGTISAGSQDTMRKLIDQRLIDTFNNHKHGGVDAGPSHTDEPRASDLLSLATHATSNTEAS